MNQETRPNARLKIILGREHLWCIGCNKYHLVYDYQDRANFPIAHQGDDYVHYATRCKETYKVRKNLLRQFRKTYPFTTYEERQLHADILREGQS